MPNIKISIDEDAVNVLEKRAKKNFLTLKEQIEEIIRKSAIRSKNLSGSSINIDDRLDSIFSKSRRGRKRKKVKG